METIDVYRSIATIAADVVVNYATEIIVDVKQLVQINDILSTGRSIHLGVGNENEAFEKAWNSLRSKNGAELLIEMTSEFHMRMTLQGFDMAKVIDAFAKSYSLRKAPSSLTFIDDVVITRAYDEKSLNERLTANVWMVFLLITSKEAKLCKLVREILAEINTEDQKSITSSELERAQTEGKTLV